MVTLVVFVNLFFAPIISVWIYCKKSRTAFEPTLKLFAVYAIFMVCNVPLAKVGNVFAKGFLKREISIDSGYYTILAIISALVLPFLYEKGRLLYENWVVVLKKQTLKYSQKLSIVFLPLLLLALIYGILGPLEIYAANTQDLTFSAVEFMPQMIAISIGVLLGASFLIALLPDWPFRMMSALLFGLGVASWLQTLFLNIKLSEPDGGWLRWESLGRFPEIDLLIWLIVVAFVLVLCIRMKSWASLLKLVPGGLCVVQVAALITVCVTMPEPAHGSLTLLGDDQMKLAAGENVIVFILDSVDNALLEDLFQEEPETADVVKDFEWFTNGDNRYYYTFPSVTHMLTGYQLDFEKSDIEWLREAWNSERANRFYAALTDAGYQRMLYEVIWNQTYVFGSVDNLNGKFENVQKGESEINTRLLLKNMVKLSIYRAAPYVLKKPFGVLTSEFSDVITPTDSKPILSLNYEFYQRLTEERLSTDSSVEKMFTVQLLHGVHEPYRTSRDGTYQEESTQSEVMRGLIAILQEYFQQMKDLGVYDNATIIITADHGRNPNNAGGMMYQPIFLLKRTGETHDRFLTNSAPVYWDDIQATILELIGKNDGSFGTSFFDWESGDERQRTLYLHMNDPDYPSLPGYLWNCYYVYKHDKDGSELENVFSQGTPESIVLSPPWQ